MATAAQKRQYYKAKRKSDRYYSVWNVLNIITGILAVVWTVGLSGGVLFQTFTWLLNWLKTSGPGGYSFKMVYIVFICMGICAYCLVAVILGIITAVKAHGSITHSDSIAFGVFSFIFAFVLPGIMYLVTRYIYGFVDNTLRDPDDVEREEREAQEEAEAEAEEEDRRRRDPRRKFTIDAEDEGEIPDPNDDFDYDGVGEFIPQEGDID